MLSAFCFRSYNGATVEVLLLTYGTSKKTCQSSHFLRTKSRGGKNGKFLIQEWNILLQPGKCICKRKRTGLQGGIKNLNKGKAFGLVDEKNKILNGNSWHKIQAIHSTPLIPV